MDVLHERELSDAFNLVLHPLVVLALRQIAGSGLVRDELFRVVARDMADGVHEVLVIVPLVRDGLLKLLIF